MKKIFFSIIGILFSMNSFSQTSPFIFAKGKQFILEGKPYHYLGTNFWYGMNLASKGKGGDRKRLVKELDQLKSLGINNLRIMAGSEGSDNSDWRMSPTLQYAPGKYNNELLDGLDFLLSEMANRKMYAVVCLNNFWPWSGGMAQYHAWTNNDNIPYPPPAKKGKWLKYMLFTAKFYKNPKAIEYYHNFVKYIVSRTNSYTGLAYKDDPTIMSWQLANEPRGMTKRKKYLSFLLATAQLIKDLDNNHMVSIGSEGNTSSFTAGNHFYKDHISDLIDYTTIHIWVQNWHWYHPKRAERSLPKAIKKAMKYIAKHNEMANQLNKPMVLEEFGISRDEDNHAVNSRTNIRDKFYQIIFEEVYQATKNNSALTGCNFWAWGGLGRPKIPKGVWKAGDEFIGDPPHEYQGWYSVYDVDSSTLEVIRSYAKKMNGLSEN